ncbi:YhdP family protein [Govanella unica]|uniref:DUF3971 domain-containing protein n=1 Tax=Govanella unica TaxID=2975056 RepID=A0A9X3TX08_9PROT|nr:AsmA-like C-terminal region-containing protein [Govania unica]MDA5193550.1 DUF3971 domain-containing protein [Govania unica]
MTDPVPPVTDQGSTEPAVATASGRHWHVLHLVMKGAWISLGLVLVLLIVLVVRIAIGPVSLGPLAPFLKAGLSDSRSDLQFEFDDGEVAWLGRKEGLKAPGQKDRLLPGFEFRLHNVRVRNAQQQVLLTVPDAALTLSTTALIAGDIAPGRIELNGLHLALDWTKGDLFAALTEGEGEGVGPVLRELLEPVKSGTTIGYLRVIGIRGADVRLHEAMTGSDWALRDAALLLQRSTTRVSMHASGALLRDGSAATPVEISSILEPEATATTMAIRFKDFNPSRFAGQSEALAKIKVADMALTGVVNLTFKRGGDAELQALTLDLAGGAGVVTLPDLYPDPLRIDGSLLRGSYAPEAGVWTIAEAKLRFAGAEIAASGTYGADDRGPALAITGSISNLPLAQLKDYWPSKYGKEAHDWVRENLTAGRASKASFKVAITPDMWDHAGGMPAEALDLRFDFDGVTAHYLRPMPPIVDGVGTARLSLHEFELKARTGSTAGVTLKDSTIRFDRIHLDGKAEARATLHMEGSVPKVLALIDNKPLGYPSAYGLKPDSVQGQSQTDLTLSFPLIKNVSLDDVKFDVKSRLDGVAIPELFTGVTLRSDHLELAVTPTNLSGKGQISLNTVPFALDWAENFLAGKGALSSTFHLKGRVAGKDWDVINLPFAEVVKGPADVDFTLRGSGPTIKRGEGRMDFTAASFGFHDIGWTKPAGIASEARFRFVKPAPDRLVVQDLTYSDPGMQASGSLTTSDARGLEKMVIDSLRAGRTMLAATVTRNPANDYDVALTAATLDGSFYINRLLHSKAVAAGAAEPEMKLPNFTLDAYAAELYALEGVQTRNVEVKARYHQERWGTSKLSGDYAKGGRFQFALADPEDARPRSFTLMSTNAGETAHGLGLLNHALGGVLTATGTMTEPGPEQVVTASIEARDFRLTKAPVLTKILTIGSLTGIRDILSGDGVTFERAIVPLTFKHGLIRVDNGRAWGAAIGVTLKGEFDIDSGQTAVGGTIVPSYTANNVLGKLPFIGNLIMGGEGKGLFAFTYNVKGSFDNPDVSVNPLAVLTPGFLRWIFEPNPKLKKPKESEAKAETDVE